MDNLTERPRRPPQDWESVVDKAIREAQERGEFDNLPGKGRPLRWDDEHVPPELRMVNRILKNAGFAPSWIEDDKWIRAERKAVRQLLDSFVDWRLEERTALAGKPEPEVASRLEELAVARDRRVTAYRERAGKLNQRIDNFNLTVPISKLQWRRVRVDEEIQRFRRMLEDVMRYP
ncbi:MAG: DnaJ family domain-containing protein [Anaerolineae bacterium]